MQKYDLIIKIISFINLIRFNTASKFYKYFITNRQISEKNSLLL